jgi:hypothetical protein
VASIIGFPLTLMVIPAFLLSMLAEMALSGGFKPKWFATLAGLAGGMAGANSMAFMYRREAANKALKSRTLDGAA